MRLLSVAAQNFKSFAELDLGLNVDGIVAVVGPNGAGKTTIFSAIEWALYGQRGRGSMPVRRDGAAADEACWVQVEFEAGGRSYRVKRIDGKGATLVDLANVEPIATSRDETTRRVAALLGMNKDMFRGTFYARQKEVRALELGSDKNRREQVELLLGIERLRLAASSAADSTRDQHQRVAALVAGAPDMDQMRATLERAQLDAEAGAPDVQAAEAELAQAREARAAVSQELEALHAREREMNSRRTQLDAARHHADEQARARDALAEQVVQADQAGLELTELAPTGDRASVLAVQEREMDLLRANHEDAVALRASQERALSEHARLADQVAQFEGAAWALLRSDFAQKASAGTLADAHAALVNDIRTAEHELESARDQQLRAHTQTQAADREVTRIRDLVTRGERAEVLDVVLSDLLGARDLARELREEWHSKQALRTQLADAITHDTQHRDAIIAGEAQAECPTCKRPYDTGELDTILERFEADLRAAHAQLAGVDDAIERLGVARAHTDQRAEQEQTVAADRRALGDVPTGTELSAVRTDLERAEQELAASLGEEARLGARVEELTSDLPGLRGCADEIGVMREHISELAAQRDRAAAEARLYAERLQGFTVNGYDPDAHELLKRQLAAAVAAGHRCAALRAKADGADLLRRRLVEQERSAADARAKCDNLIAAFNEVALDPEAVESAAEARDEADERVEQATTRLIEANRRASADSEAVAAAHARMQDAREQHARLKRERAELRIRREVSDALSAYREGASRQARPQLEDETAMLLGQTTRGRYNSVSLSDSYKLEIVEGRTVHPLDRFSGGEQDLASLCLRLGLSRMLARSRGTETGFVLLDEVLGSQDLDRRRSLLEQLRVIAEREFRQVFVVSHTDDVVGLCDLRIDVRRDENDLSVALGPVR
jgi:DNA repair protein SbcC/Rad50